MKKLVIGILAHVDAGKTTLSESMLYLSGKIRKMGRVDNKDAYLDTYTLEKERGITIFSKQAIFEMGDVQITLLDTPGHVDFSAEMERTLQVLDYAVLVVSGADGIQGHTQTLWRLLKMYDIPTFIFINKMDQPGSNREALLGELKKRLGETCIAFDEVHEEAFYEEVALCDEPLMTAYLETGKITDEQMIERIYQRQLFPCYFGSALKMQGVETFLEGLSHYTCNLSYNKDFGAKVFKIIRDEQGNRLTYMKITGGSLKVKTVLTNKRQQEDWTIEDHLWEEKVNQIRLYSGQKFETVNEVFPGDICAVMGLTHTRAGQGLGIEKDNGQPLLEPVLAYRIILPDGCDPKVIMPKLRQLEEEEPELHIVWDDHLKEIQAQLMGEVQIEILQRLVYDRFGIEISFGPGTILYKETIANTVEGVGHFEPLRHYAEVHLLMAPGERGSGLVFDVNCSEDLLEKNWQRLILTHLEEKAHKGVLTGSFITDIKITLVAGKAHKKHTEGGDFREATYRAVRQGLKQAESVLLEPYYAFQLELPEKMVGRAMTDIEKMQGCCEITETDGEMTCLTGSAPVAKMKNYQKEVTAYTKGCGKLFCTLKGYEVCQQSEEIIAQLAYDSERDIENPTSSVFCAHGSGFIVSWDQVHNYMHIESYFTRTNNDSDKVQHSGQSDQQDKSWIDLEEIDQILHQTFYANQGEKSRWKRSKPALESHYRSITTSSTLGDKKQEYLLVDGYNIIFAWQELKKLSVENMDGAKMKLLDCLCNYQGIKKCHIIVVFDAYRVQGHQTEMTNYHNIHVVYTKEAETADRYIEKFAHQHHEKYQVTVATSDGLEQIIIRGKGCRLLSARELEEEVARTNQQLLEAYKESQPVEKNYLSEIIDSETKQTIEKWIKKEEYD